MKSKKTPTLTASDERHPPENQNETEMSFTHPYYRVKIRHPMRRPPSNLSGRTKPSEEEKITPAQTEPEFDNKQFYLLPKAAKLSGRTEAELLECAANGKLHMCIKSPVGLEIVPFDKALERKGTTFHPPIALILAPSYCDQINHHKKTQQSDFTKVYIIGWKDPSIYLPGGANLDAGREINYVWRAFDNDARQHVVVTAADIYVESNELQNFMRENPTHQEAQDLVPGLNRKKTDKTKWTDEDLRKLWDYHREHPEVRQGELAEKLGVTRQRASVLLNKAKEKFGKPGNSWQSLLGSHAK